MRSLRVGTLAAALLLLLLPLVLSSCYITCACASPLDPNWTPPPVSDIEAGAYAAKVAGLPNMTAELSGSIQGRPIYQASGNNTLGFVDSESGVVFEVVAVDEMPNRATVEPPDGAAKSAADAFMTRTGLRDDNLIESSMLKTVSGVSAYDFTWKDSLGSAKFTISVNPSTKLVFAYTDLQMQSPLTPPILGKAAATQLAIAAHNVPGDQVTSAEFGIDFSSGVQVSSWAVGLGVPTATDPNVFEHGALISVDAVTGETVIVKS
jgi:hypothetical protein